VLAGVCLLAGQAVGSDFDLAETTGALHLWHAADGLPSDSVTAIIQTPDGFLWIGASAGLARFDGVKFTVESVGRTTNRLTGVTALCEDSNGHLWVGTQRNGVFELAEGRFTNYTRKHGLLDEYITSLAADAKGQVWIGGASGLNLWDGESFKSFTTRDGLPDEFVSGVNVARSGAVWITTRSGMSRFSGGGIAPYAFQTDSQGRSPEYLGAYEDRRGNLWAFGDTYLINLAEGKRFNYFRGSEPASVRIWSLCEGLHGRLWIGTSGRGLFCFEDNSIRPVILGESRWPYDVRAICEDREGNLWLGTSGGGLAQLRPQSVHVVRGGLGLPESAPTALALDRNGRVFVGLERGGLWAGEAGRFDQFTGGGFPLVQCISSVCVDHDGVVWAGTTGDGLYGLRDRGGVHLTTADGLDDNTILAVAADPQTGVWASTPTGSVHHVSKNGSARFGTLQGLPGAPVTSMIPAAGGGIWLGTQDGQILREKDGVFTRPEGVMNWGGSPAVALCESQPNRLWIGARGGGLTLWTEGLAAHWGVNNGLPSQVIWSVLEDASKNLWLATASGIYRVSPGDLRQSLANSQVSLACRLVSPAKITSGGDTILGGPRGALGEEGSLWFAVSDGILKVNAQQPEAEPPSFPVCLESAIINGQPAMPLLSGPLWSPGFSNAARYRMPVDLRSLEIQFTALSFVAPDEIQFRHKMDGFDPDWVSDAGARAARYGRLQHGNYTFRVAARAGDGVWQEAAQTFAFVVPTPVYLQPWALALYFISAVGAIVGTVRVISHRRLRNKLARLEQQQALERERMRIARDMHDEMGSKLTKISFMSERLQVDAESAGTPGDRIQSIAQTARDLLKTMDEIVWVVNPRNDSLENLTAYLSQYALEYFQNTSVECELRLPQDIPSHPLSSEARHNIYLTFEETLNNALKHSSAAKVKVEMSVDSHEFRIVVSDNGKGFDLAAAEAKSQARGGRGGNGLRNMRQRVAAVGGECSISSAAGAGATVTIRVRLNSKNNPNEA